MEGTQIYSDIGGRENAAKFLVARAVRRLFPDINLGLYVRIRKVMGY